MILLLRLLAVVLNTVAVLIDGILNRLLPRRKPTFPPLSNKLLSKSVTELLADLRQKKLTSEELVQAYITRIEEVNASLNAVIEDRFEEALRKARHADQLLANATTSQQLVALVARYPLLGIPFTVKESCGLKDASFAVASIVRKDIKCAENSEVVDLLCAAGCIPLLVSATSEFCLAFETNSVLNGRCLNPYDLRRSSAGSSGGEGALNGAGASLFGVGSDIGGSIRLPALFCGVFGHKPTGGLVSVKGHFPYSSTDPEFPNYLQMGPLTRFARDLPVLLQVMAGQNAEKLKLGESINVKDIKIFYTYSMGSWLHPPVDFDIKLAITRAVKCFQKGGLHTEQIHVAGFQNALELCLSAIGGLKGVPSIYTPWLSEKPRRKILLMDLIRSLIGHSFHITETICIELLMSIMIMSEDEAQKWKTELQLLREELINLLGTDAVLFLPTYHKSANFFNDSLLNISGIALMMLFNILGFPATHIPMGLDRRGLPIGFQVVAAPFQDKLCLQIAAELEGAFGGWVPPVKHPYA